MASVNRGRIGGNILGGIWSPFRARVAAGGGGLGWGPGVWLGLQIRRGLRKNSPGLQSLRDLLRLQVLTVIRYQLFDKQSFSE